MARCCVPSAPAPATTSTLRRSPIAPARIRPCSIRLSATEDPPVRPHLWTDNHVFIVTPAASADVRDWQLLDARVAGTGQERLPLAPVEPPRSGRDARR